MKTFPGKFFLLPVLGSLLCILLFSACNPEEIEIPPPAAFVTISGTVLALTLPLPAPLPDATVELLDGSLSTTSGPDGSWTLENVPTGQDPVIKVTAEGSPFDYLPAYNTFPLSLNLMKYDLQIMDPCLYLIMVLDHVLAGASLDDLCLVFGVVVGFTSMDPLVVQPLAGAKVSVQPDSLDVVYLSEEGMGDPSLIETSSIGAFIVVVPDANTITEIMLTGTLPGSMLVGPPVQPTFPGGFVPAGLVDPFNVP